jgi:hypothetical protein
MGNPYRGITNRLLIIGQICGFLVMDVRIIFMNDKEKKTTSEKQVCPSILTSRML